MLTRRRFAALATSLPALLPAQYEESRGETPWVPSPDEVIETMLRLARVTRRDTVLDLGCGDGRVIVMAARKFGARGIGIDIEPARIEESRQAARQAGVARRVRFLEQDFHQAKVSDATVVTMYLFTAVMAKLKPKLRSELHPGTRVVAYQFNGMGDWAPQHVDRSHKYPIFLWTV